MQTIHRLLPLILNSEPIKDLVEGFNISKKRKVEFLNKRGTRNDSGLLQDITGWSNANDDDLKKAYRKMASWQEPK